MRERLVWPVTLLVALALVLGFGYFVWPGQWVYSQDGTLRSHRIYPITEEWAPLQGWHRASAEK